MASATRDMEAFAIGRRSGLRPDWDDVKVDVMRSAVSKGKVHAERTSAVSAAIHQRLPCGPTEAGRRVLGEW